MQVHEKCAIFLSFQGHFGIQVNAFIFLSGKLRTACKNVDGSAVDSRLSQTNFKLVAVECVCWGGGMWTAQQ